MTSCPFLGFDGTGFFLFGLTILFLSTWARHNISAKTGSDLLAVHDTGCFGPELTTLFPFHSPRFPRGAIFCCRVVDNSCEGSLIVLLLDSLRVRKRNSTGFHCLQNFCTTILTALQHLHTGFQREI